MKEFDNLILDAIKKITKEQSATSRRQIVII